MQLCRRIDWDAKERGCVGVKYIRLGQRRATVRAVVNVPVRRRRDKLLEDFGKDSVPRNWFNCLHES
jgi:hypothetical protein